MKRYLKGGLISLFLLLVLSCGIAFHTLVQSQTNGRLINYVGIVRGATQRLVKLELAGQSSDELVEYLDGILLELKSGEGGYGLPCPDDPDYRGNLAELEQMWAGIKKEITALRGGGDGAALLVLSEDYFIQANDTVFSADAYAARQMRLLLTVCLVAACFMALTWLFLFWAYSKNMLKLEVRNKELSEQAKRDPLTGVYQLEPFKEMAQRIMDAEAQYHYALVYTDFADFRYINDLLGHGFGDQILAKYGEILLMGLRNGEVCGRVSADNFVLLLRYQDKGEIAQRQRAADQKIVQYLRGTHAGQLLPTRCGICCVEDVVEDLRIDGFLDRANFARKAVKSDPNLNYVYYDESIRRRLWEQKDVENKMLDALDNREFTVFYQPKVDLHTGKMSCAEALVRWQSQGGSIIPPDRFIPVFERRHLIDQLDQFVFEEVCRWLRSMLDAGKPALPVSVNVSRLQFYDQNFVERYAGIRDKYAIPPGLLEIEFTESIAIDNTALLVRTVNRLKKEGFTCTIDDFGKGYSSLGMLKSLPIDILKIDSFFFADGPDREKDLAIVESIVELVRKFGIKTVAEGIETQEQVKYLRGIGCDYIQGYVFYRPMPQQDYERLLAAES